MTRKALLLVTAALLAVLTTASPGTVALGQTTDEDVSYTGSAMDSFGAKFEAVAGLAFDPHFAYAQSVVFEQTPLATAHAYVAFPGTLIASTMITCCGASADYPRFGGRLPSETICGDPGNDKESVPEIRDPRNHDPNAPNPVTGQKPSPAPSPYNTNCTAGSQGCDVRSRGNPIHSEDADKRWRVSEGFGRSYCDAAAKIVTTDQRANNVLINPSGTQTSSIEEDYVVRLGSVTMLAKSEHLAASAAKSDRILTTVDARAKDLSVKSGNNVILEIGEVRALATAEANGKENGALVSVTRTVRGVRVLGNNDIEVSEDAINRALAPTGLSIRFGPVKRDTSGDGTSAAVDATALIIEQSAAVSFLGGVQAPEYRMTLARATPSASFFKIAFEEIPELPGGFELPSTDGEPAPVVLALPPDQRIEPPPMVPAVRRPSGGYIVQGTFAGLDWSGIKVSWWPLKDIVESFGGLMLLGAALLFARHRRRFI